MESPLVAFGPVSDPTEARIMTSPSGALLLLTLGLQEGLTRQLSETWSLDQSTAYVFGYPIDTKLVRARTYTIQNSLGASKSFSLDTLSLTLSSATSYFTVGQDAGGAVIPRRAQLADTLMLSWSRTFLPSLSGMLTAGVTQIVTPGGLDGMSLEPSGVAALIYSREPATVAISYQRAVAPNLGTGQLDKLDTVAARFSVPIGAEKLGLTAAGSVGFTRATAIGSDGVPGAPTNVFLTDAAATYVPSFADVLSAGLRFQIIRQVPGAETLPAFTSYAASFSLAFSYPSANAARARASMTPVYSVAPPTTGEFVSSDPAPAPAP
jgi:hypothetical protein